MANKNKTTQCCFNYKFYILLNQSFLELLLAAASPQKENRGYIIRAGLYRPDTSHHPTVKPLKEFQSTDTDLHDVLHTIDHVKSCWTNANKGIDAHCG